MGWIHDVPAHLIRLFCDLVVRGPSLLARGTHVVGAMRHGRVGSSGQSGNVCACGCGEGDELAHVAAHLADGLREEDATRRG
eukprot:7095556-Pyramimonas_sp.AAC.1